MQPIAHQPSTRAESVELDHLLGETWGSRTEAAFRVLAARYAPPADPAVAAAFEAQLAARRPAAPRPPHGLTHRHPPAPEPTQEHPMTIQITNTVLAEQRPEHLVFGDGYLQGRNDVLAESYAAAAARLPFIDEHADPQWAAGYRAGATDTRDRYLEGRQLIAALIEELRTNAS